jgi:hypothetical protein
MAETKRIILADDDGLDPGNPGCRLDIDGISANLTLDLFWGVLV